ncbi:MAG: class I SAM-dependent methyltransferase [Chloroflexi bacterium]|nr:class I SAM-dependent methyltransferase [Chloroflexota bacterium]
METSSYEEQLAREGEIWGRAARDLAARIPPDWREHRKRLRHNIVFQGANIDEFLNHIRPGMRVLDLGCGAGWLTLAMAQRGAEATGIDISAESLNVAREYYESIRHEVPGSVRYEIADLNQVSLTAGTYDVIAVCGALHHLTNARHTIEEAHQALRPGGLFWASDLLGEESRAAAVLTGALMFLLPIEISYRDKFAGLFRFGLHSPERVKAALEGEGFSPFEGAAREEDWFAVLRAQFVVQRAFHFPKISHYFAGPEMIRLPDRWSLPLLRGIAALERALLRIGWLRGTGWVIYARKAAE